MELIKIDKLFTDKTSKTFGNKAVLIIEEVRKIKAEKNLSMKSVIDYQMNENLPNDLIFDLKNMLNFQ